MKKFLILSPVLIVLVFLFFVFLNREEIQVSETGLKNLTDNILERDSDFSFKELTIPYLRDRKYKSEIGKLEFYREYQNYNSYLTSYISENLKINALLTVPEGKAPNNGFPAVVFVHGYIPPASYKTTEKYVEYIDYLARNGIVVLKIDLRGHGDSEGEANGAYYSSDYIIDVLSAYDALSNYPGVDKNNISLWGHSMAGNVLLRSVAVNTNIPKIVIWAGAVYTYDDFLKYGIGDNSYRPPSNDSQRQQRRRQLMEHYGQFNSSSWFWKQVVATNYIDNLKTKIQIHHSSDDNVVDVNYSRDLENILKEKNIDVSYYEYTTGGHNITGTSFSKAMQETVEFLKN